MLRLPCLIAGRYRIERHIGEGGFGSVFAGVHIVLETPVAVKVLRLAPSLTAEERDELTARFLAEGRVLTRLRHPHIVGALDLGLLPADEEGRAAPYLAMEWVEGTTLESVLAARSTRLTIAEAWELFEPLLDAMACAHAARVVHRDLKPANVMVVPSGGSIGVPRVIDFGIAKIVAPDETAGAGATSTASPSSPFTRAYAAPEQVAQARTGPWTDVHALGLLFVELVTGALPYARYPDPRLAAVDPERPTPRAAGVDAGALEAVIARAVALRPGDRFADAGEMLLAARDAAKTMGLAISPPRRSESALPEGAPPSPSSSPSAEGMIRAEAASGLVDHPSVTPSGVQSGAIAATLVTQPEPPSRKAGLRSLAVVAALVVAAPIALFALSGSRARKVPASAPPASSATQVAPALRVEGAHALTLDPGCEEFPSLAPDDRSIVFSAAVGHDFHVFRLDLATSQRTQLTFGKGWNSHASFSPDGRHIVFDRVGDVGGTLELSLVDKTPERLVAKGDMRPSYSPDGSAIWAGKSARPTRLDRATGAVSRALVPPPAIFLHAVIESPTGDVVALAEDPQAVPLGLLRYAKGDDKDPVWLLRAKVHSSFAFTPQADAVVATVDVGSATTYELWRAPLDGSPPHIVPGNTLIPARGLSFSHRGDRVAWSSCDQTSDVVALESRGEAWSTPPPTNARRWVDETPAAIPGKTALVLRSDRDGRPGLWVVEPSGAVPARKIPIGDLNPLPPGVSHDGGSVVFQADGRGIFVVPVDGSAPPRRLTDDRRHEGPRFSRDDRRIFFGVNFDDGTSEIDALTLADGTIERIVPPGASLPALSPTDDGLIYARAEKDGSQSVVLLSLATRRTRVLVPNFLPNTAGWFSPDGARYVAYDDFQALEVDLATHAVVRRYQSSDSLMGLAYSSAGAFLARSTWSGDIWIANIALE